MGSNPFSNSQQAYNGYGMANAAAQPGYSPYQQQNSIIAQQQAAAQLQQWIQQQRPKRWMFNGVAMTFEEFVSTMFPEDTPEKTMFILKYKGNEND